MLLLTSRMADNKFHLKSNNNSILILEYIIMYNNKVQDKSHEALTR